VWDGVDFVEVASGDVDGPSSATDNAVARFNGTTGKLVQNSLVTIDDSGNVSGVVQINTTTVDATNVEVTNIKAKDGTAALQIADSTGVVSVTAAPVLTALTASQAVFTDASKGLVSNAITGTGNVVMSTSPTLVTPALGTPSSVTLTNGTGLPISTGVSGLGAGVATFLATPSSANLATAVTDETGSGALVFATSPTLVTPDLGTPSALVGTNITGTAAGLTAGNVTTNANLTGAVTSVGNATSLGSFTSANLRTALTDETGSGSAVFATSPTLVTPALGTPSSATLTNATGLPISTGVSGLGAGVATFLATPSSANLAAAVTDETGTGALVFATSPTLVTPALGTPASGVVTNLTGTASININGTVGATTPAAGSFTNITGSANAIISVTDNTNAALRITQLGTGNALLVEDNTNPDVSPLVVNNIGQLIVGHTEAIGAGQNTNIQSQGTGGVAGVSAFRWSNDATPPRLQVGKSRGAAVGTNAIVQSGDQLGGVYFYGDDGTDLVTQGASIIAEVDGTPGSNDMPGRLLFSTTADGGSLPTERMRIDSAGQTTFSYNAVISVSDATNAALRITQTGTGNALVVEDSANPDATPFVIDAGGRVIQGYTTAILTADDYNGTNRTAWGIQGNVVNTASALFTAWSTAATSGAGISLSRSKSATVGTQAIVFSGDSLGGIGFNGDDGTNFIVAASITSAVDGTPGTDDMPGRLVFSTTADGASTPTERIRITSAGKTGFATAAPAATVHVAGDTILSNVNVIGASYDSVSFSVAGEEVTPTDLFFSPDGLKMYIVGAGGDDVNEYNLSTAWVVSSAVFATNFSVSGQDTSPQGLFFRADGTKMYVLGTTNDEVFQYTLSTPWSVATASYDNISFSVAAQDLSPQEIFFKPNGLSMYVVGSTNPDSVYQYTLSTAWNVSTATFLQSLSIFGQESSPNGMTFTGDGSRMFVTGSTGDDVNVFNLTTPWDISTSDFVGVFSVAGQDLSPQGIYVKPDGTKMYMVGSTNDAVFQYTVPSIDIQLTGPTSVAALDVQQDLTVYGNTQAYKISASSVATFSAGTAAAPAITTTGDTNTGIFFPAADTIAFSEGGAEAMRIDSAGNVLVTSAAGLGYGTGAGGTVTQATSRTTGVTLSKPTGAITMFSAAGSIVAATFTVTNTLVAATDTIILNQKSGTNLYVLLVTAVAAGSFNITFYTTGGIATDAPEINFSLIKGVTA
jgi:hypothetical protein